jgi:hypothetical protein
LYSIARDVDVQDNSGAPQRSHSPHSSLKRAGYAAHIIMLLCCETVETHRGDHKSEATQPSCHVIVNERGIGRHCVGEAQCLAIREWLKEILTHKRFAASEGHHAKFRHLRQLIEKALRFVRR